MDERLRRVREIHSTMMKVHQKRGEKKYLNFIDENFFYINFLCRCALNKNFILIDTDDE